MIFRDIITKSEAIGPGRKSYKIIIPNYNMIFKCLGYQRKWTISYKIENHKNGRPKRERSACFAEKSDLVNTPLWAINYGHIWTLGVTYQYKL